MIWWIYIKQRFKENNSSGNLERFIRFMITWWRFEIDIYEKKTLEWLISFNPPELQN